jgi:heptosyltransferase III
VRVLVSRTDRLGDVVLTLPLCAMLARRLGAEIVVLGRRYTRPVLEASPYVREVLDWDEVADAGVGAQRDLLARARVDAILHVFPRPAIARAALAARIPLRIGTSHRWQHWLTCNALEHFSRKRSSLHEAQSNVRLAMRLLGDAVPSTAELSALTTLSPRAAVPAAVQALIDRGRTMIVLHPGSSGSASDWPLARWTELVESLDPSQVQCLVTGSAEEGTRLGGWLARLSPSVVDLTGRLSVAELIALLASVDGLVAASTGPLHLAAALGIHALGLFVPTPPIHPGRWAPLGPRAEVLVSSTSDVGDIDATAVAGRVRDWVSRRAR